VLAGAKTPGGRVAHKLHLKDTPTGEQQCPVGGCQIGRNGAKSNGGGVTKKNNKIPEPREE